MADDDADIVRFVEVNLRLEGFQVVTARDGQEALTKALDLQPDVILLDVLMPRIDGYTVCERLRADQRGAAIPVILLTANFISADQEVARRAGADDVVLLDGFRDAVAELTGGRGVDVVVDVVGGDVFTDSLRSLAPQGRLLVVGFAAGQGIPEVRVNRLLLNNVDVRGVGWGAYAMVRPGYLQEQWAALLPLLASGVIDPPIGATYAFDDFGRALADLDDRAVLGKAVVRVRDED